MAYDDIIIGSGLSGLATAMGLAAQRRILVLTESDPAQVRYYDARSNVPNAVRGPGGLGNFWHGVIAFGARAAFAQGSQAGFEELFTRFYPKVEIGGRYGTNWLFVPRRPIRPAAWWPRLAAERAGQLELIPLTASRFQMTGGGITVEAGGERFSASRLWICAGALDTPAVLARSLSGDFGFRGTAADHVVAYMGQIDRRDHPATERPSVQLRPEGYWLDSLPASSPNCLVTAKPAWFSYRTLDHGIEQRAAFGLPVGGAIGKIIRSGSLGLLSEAAFNKLGLFGNSRILSIYGQVRVPAAHQLDLETGALEIRLPRIEEQLDAARDALELPGLVHSRRTDLFVRGIHLHDTLDADALVGAGVNRPQSNVRVMDASAIGSIGGEHHSFHMMANAFTTARQA